MPKLQQQNQTTTVQDRTELLKQADEIFTQMRVKQQHRHKAEQEDFNDAENILFKAGLEVDALTWLDNCLWHLREESERVLPDLVHCYLRAQENGVIVATKNYEVFEFVDRLHRVAMYSDVFKCMYDEVKAIYGALNDLTLDEFQKFEIKQSKKGIKTH